MRARLVVLSIAVLSIAVLSIGCVEDERKVPGAAFLVIVDTLRADRISCYGYDEHATPNVDTLARRGVRFENAQSVASWTRPSVGAILTSMYPEQLGLIELPAPGKTYGWRDRREQASYRLPPFGTTLAEVLRAADWKTAAFIDQPALNPSFSRGFDAWYYPTADEEIRELFADGDATLQEWPSTRRSAAIDRALVAEFDRWLAENASQRPFAWIHLLTPHAPYNPDSEFAPAGGEDVEHDDSTLYDGEVRAVDAMIGGILQTIERHVGLDRSLIVFCSDHGEEFGEHGMSGHGHSLHREVIQVPLIIAAPELPAGRTVTDYVRTIDLLPTILDLTGLQAATPALAEGRSLIPLVRGREPAQPVFSQAMLYGSTERSLIEGGWKAMYDEQGEQWRFFALEEDRAEATPRQADPERARRMTRRLDEWVRRLRSDHRRKGNAGQETPAWGEAEEKALKALGYVDSE